MSSKSFVNSEMYPSQKAESRGSVDIADTNVDAEERVAFLQTSAGSNIAKTGEQKTKDKVIVLALQAIVLLLAFGVLFAASDLNRSIKRATRSDSDASIYNDVDEHPCGTDANTARRAGCYFDPVTVSWLPSQCHDFNLTTEFLEEHKWQFWLDPDRDTRPISLANVMQSEHETLFVDKDYLRHRCVFAYRKMHRAILNSSFVDGYVASMEEAIICDDFLRDRERDEKLYRVDVGFPSCKNYR